MASKKEYTMLFALNASLNGGFQTTFTKASAAVAGMQKEIQALAKEQSDITAYEKQQKGIEATEKKLATLQQQYDNIQKEISETEGYSSALENRLLSKQQQIDKTSASLAAQNEKLGEMGTALRDAGIDTNALTSESQRLEKEMSELKKEQESAAKSAEEYGEKASDAFQAAGEAIIATGLVNAVKELGKAYGECVKLSADFDSAMSQVAATMGTEVSEISELSEFAKRMGAETKFTAIEAADGINILAMSGLKEREIMEALPTVLNLASAGAMDLATSASYVTGTVKGFSDGMDRAGYYADLMAKGATMANTNVSQLGEALGGSAATAKAYGQEADGLTVSLLRLAEQNVTGSEAATMLNRAMADLYTPTKESSAALEALGVTMYDLETGEAKEFNSCISEIQAALAGMSAEEQNTYKNTLFTTNGLKAFNMMTASSTEKVTEFWTGLAKASGSAGKQAETQLDNLNGRLTILNSAWDGLRTSLGEATTGELSGLVDVGTDILGNINELVKKNPGLVKGIITATGVLGGATAGITAASVAVKFFSTTVATAFPQIGAIMAVTAGVAALAGGIVALKENMDNTVPAAEALHEATQGLTDCMTESKGTMEDNITETEATAAVVEGYVRRLEELEAVTEKTDAEQLEYHNILSLISEKVPELAGIIDLETDTIKGGTEAILANTEAWKENAKAAAYTKYISELQEEYTDVLVAQAKAQIKQTEAQNAERAAQEKLDAAIAERNRLLEEANREAKEQTELTGMYCDVLALLPEEYYTAKDAVEQYEHEVAVAQDTQKQIQEELDATGVAVASAEAVILQATDTYNEFTRSVEDQSGSQANLAREINSVEETISGLMQPLMDLAEEYNEVYESAKGSLEGQYALWDDVAKVTAVSADTMAGKISAQAEYWRQYNDNLAALRDRAGDIEGLSDVIASFADGSEESVNAVAGMAQASDEDLAAMVANYEELREAQGETAENIAALATDFDEKTQEIADSVRDMVSDMNLSDEAAAAARETVQAYIAAASGMVGTVQEAYGSVGAAARQSLYGTQASVRPGHQYASGTKDAEPGLALVGEKGPELVNLSGGEQITPANETAKLLSDPVPTADNSKHITITNEFRIEGNASEDTVERLSQYGEEFAERVVAVMEEHDIDAKRRSYT